MKRSRRVFSIAVQLMTWASAAACVPPARMCTVENDCGTRASCLAGRCVGHGATPAIEQSRRLLFAPVDVAYLRRGAEATAEGTATLGSARHPGALALLRFSVTVPPEATVLEAYLLLERATTVDSDPMPVALHAARVAEPWDGRVVSWGRQPRIEEIEAPVTAVSPRAGTLVRLDVRDLVQRWRRRRVGEYGVAVVAAGASPTGIAFALTPAPGRRHDPLVAPVPAVLAGDDGFGASAVFGPRLELYIK